MKEEVNKELLKDKGFYYYNNFILEECDNNKVVLKAPIKENSTNNYNIAHGGFIFGLGDHAMGTLAFLQGGKAVTLNANINFISPGIGEYLIAKAELIKKGKKTCFLKALIYNNLNTLIATMDSTYYYLED